LKNSLDRTTARLIQNKYWHALQRDFISYDSRQPLTTALTIGANARSLGVVAPMVALFLVVAHG